MVAMSGASMAAPLAMAPTVKPGPSTRASLRIPSVVMMAVAASTGRLPAPGPGRHQAGDPGHDRRHGQGDADEPGLADEDQVAVDPEPLAHQPAHQVGVGRPPVPGGGVGVATGDENGRGPAAGGGQMGPADGHGGGGGQIAGEDPGGGDGPAVVGGHQGQIGSTGRFDPTGQSGGHEAVRRRDAHG